MLGQLLALIVLAQPAPPTETILVVKDVFCGEVDPIYVGDVCIVHATSADLGEVALVTGDASELSFGDELRLSKDDLRVIDDPDARRVLGADRARIPARSYLWWDGAMLLSND